MDYNKLINIQSKLTRMGFESYFTNNNKRLKILVHYKDDEYKKIYDFPIDDDIIHLFDKDEYYHCKCNSQLMNVLILAYPFRKQICKYEFIKAIYKCSTYSNGLNNIKHFSYIESYTGYPNNSLEKFLRIQLPGMSAPKSFDYRDKDKILSILSLPNQFYNKPDIGFIIGKSSSEAAKEFMDLIRIR